MVSTHYMDEAEGCHRIVYILDGEILATGTIAELVRDSGLHSLSVRGPALAQLKHALTGVPGIDQVAPFGDALHVTGINETALAQAIAPFAAAQTHIWQDTASTLEDVFIYLMATHHYLTSTSLPHGHTPRTSWPHALPHGHTPRTACRRTLNIVRSLSMSRVAAILLKDLIQMRRDHLTFAMIVGIPILQLTLFGFAINNNPKNLPTALYVHDHSAYTRSIINALENSAYFDLMHVNQSAAEGDAQLLRSDVAFVITIPDGFTKSLLRGKSPQLLIEAGATDPSASINAIAVMPQVVNSALRYRRLAPTGLATSKPMFKTVIHRRFNPEGITQYNIVPGLLGVILTMTMIMMTAMALTREVERGAIENLLAMPSRPIEVMIGKLLPYFLVGGVQVLLILGMARFVFNVPMLGSYQLLISVIVVFVASLAALGYLISSVARSQMQAMQMTFFFFLPSILQSGFMFPFRGMPLWAQWIGEILPLTHFLRLARGVMLKGAELPEVAPHMWPLLLFTTPVTTLALQRYRQTLDD